MLQACLNGGRAPGNTARVPVSPEELARDAREVRAAGADALHVHPRNDKGCESLDPEDVASVLLAIDEAVPGMPMGVGTVSIPD